MNRVTKINGMNYIARNQYCDYNAVLTDIQLEAANQQCIDKLGKLEDIEAELGIDLITLFKALKNGAWTKLHNEISKCDECEYKMFDIYIYFHWNYGRHLVFFLSDYGKTWALTKEELEK